MYMMALKGVIVKQSLVCKPELKTFLNRIVSSTEFIGLYEHMKIRIIFNYLHWAETVRIFYDGKT